MEISVVVEPGMERQRQDIAQAAAATGQSVPGSDASPPVGGGTEWIVHQCFDAVTGQMLLQRPPPITRRAAVSTTNR